MALKGFDPKWKDFPDYIIGITKEIWEDRNVHSLHELYAEDIPVRSPNSVVVGNKNVIAATLATIAEFPDRTLYGEDVIWSGSDETALLSSHRIVTTATHSQPGVYGQPTGNKITYRVIADCAAKDNVIFDEWLIRDQGAIVRQLGWEPKDYVRGLIEREGANVVKPLTPKNDVEGPYKSKGNDNKYGLRYSDMLTRIMQGELSVIPKDYDRACQLEFPGGFTGHSYGAADQFWAGLRASFPSAKFTIDHTIGRDDVGLSPRAALRWSLHGKHDGWGLFGEPTGAEVYVLGMSHAEFGPWGLRREYVLLDETAIWKQILMQTG